MSWISQNYEKAAIGAGVVVLAGLAFAGWSKLSGVSEDFNVQPAGKNGGGTEVAGAEKIPLAKNSLTQKRVWEQGKDGDRPVDLFTGVPLFVKKDAPNKPIDIRGAGAPIHDPIPNIWWLDNHIDPGFPDALQRDPDGDGFSNLEEWKAKTDPNDPKSHPALIAKLRYVRDESVEWLLDPGFEEAGSFGIKYGDSLKRTNRNGALNPIKPGDLFFADGVMKERFKFLGSEHRNEENPRTHIQEEKTYLKIEDQAPNKKGTVYEFQSQMNEAVRKISSKFDRTAIFTLEAVGESGKEFKVEENTTFALPPSTKKEYLLKKVTPEGIEVEYTTPGGEKKTVPIPKGGMPAADDR